MQGLTPFQGQQLCGIQQLQVFHPIPRLRIVLLHISCSMYLEVFFNVLDRWTRQTGRGEVSHTFPLLCFYNVLHQVSLVFNSETYYTNFSGFLDRSIKLILKFNRIYFFSVSSLFWYHIYLVLHNRSTLEQFRAPYFNDLSGVRSNGASVGPRADEQGWSLGKMNNFQEVFGYNKFLWLLPIHTAVGDGLTFPTR